MARPALVAINSGNQGWDGDMDDNFSVIGSAPFPVHESASLTEANLQATFPAASYDRCMVWVNHTVYGYTLYVSNGTAWIPRDAMKRITQAVTGAGTLASNVAASIFLCSGTLPYTLVLPTAANMIGRTITIKTLVAGTLTIDGSGAETIDGAANITITSQYGKVSLFSDGTTWHTVA